MPRSRVVGEAALWLLLGAVLAPIWLDWARHLAAEPAARYAALFVPLCLHLAWRERASALRGVGGRNAAGLWCVAIALVLAVLSLGAALPRFGRICLPLAVIGMAHWRGWPRLEVALLSLWWVPVPSLLLKRSGEALEWLPGAAPLTPGDAGLPLMALLSGLAYWAALVRGRPPGGALRGALLGALLALPLQAAVLLLALGAARLLADAELRAGLDAVPALVALGVVSCVWIRASGRS